MLFDKKVEHGWVRVLSAPIYKLYYSLGFGIEGRVNFLGIRAIRNLLNSSLSTDFAKWLFRGGLFLMPVVFVIGCGLKWGEKAPETPPAKISSDRFSCMGEIGETMTRFLRDELSNTAVEEFMDCVGNSVQTFLDYTKGVKSESYLPDEIRRFLTKYFITVPISDSLLKETMKIKRLIVGGSIEVVERKELIKVVGILAEIKSLMIRLNSKHYMAVINLEIGRDMLDQNLVLPDVDEASEVLVDVARSLGKILGQSNVTYSTFSLERYLVELSRFLFWKEKAECSEGCKDWSEFLAIFKQVMIGGRGDRIKSQDWENLLVYGASWYTMVMKFNFYFKPGNVLYGKGFARLRDTLGEGFDLVGKALTAQDGDNISYEKLNKLIDSLGKVDRLPFEMSAAGLKPALKVIIDKVFGDLTIPAKLRPSHGMSRRNVAQAREEFERWAETQTYLNKELLATWQSSTAGHSKKQLELNGEFNPNSRSLQAFDYKKWLTDSPASKHPVIAEVFKLAHKIRPFYRQGEPGILVLPKSLTNNDTDRFGILNLSKINLLRSIVRLLYRGFVEDPKRYLAQLGVTNHEMQEFSVAARQIGWDLKVMDPRSLQTGYRSFMEANLLAYSGTGMNNKEGENYIEMAEGIELLAYAATAGRLQTEWHAAAIALCPNGPLDVYGQKTISRKCFKHHFRHFLSSGFEHAPLMKVYLDNLGTGAWVAVREDIFQASWYPCRGSKWAEMAEMSVLTSVVQYTEIIFTRFDADENNYLDELELEAAFEIFKGYFAIQAMEATGIQLPDVVLKVVFMYLVIKGRQPVLDLSAGECTSSAGCSKVKYLGSESWLPADLARAVSTLIPLSPYVWQIRADRGMILKVFRALSEMVREKKIIEAEEQGHCKIGLRN